MVNHLFRDMTGFAAPSGLRLLPLLPSRLDLLANVDRVVERGIDDVEDAAGARHADGIALFQSVNRRDARLVAWQPAEDVDDFPAQLLLPDSAQAGKPGL